MENTNIKNAKGVLEHALWYKKPATNFNEALPLGNGRLGAMFYGDPECERIHINEDSVWSGGPRNRNNPTAKEMLPVLRRLLQEENIPEAERLVFDSMAGIPEGCRHYMPVGDLRLSLSSKAANGDAIEYLERTLDLERAVGTTSYRKGGVGFTQTLFCSAPADVLVIHCEATQGEPIDGVIFMEDGDRRDYIDDNRPYAGDIKNNEATILYTGGSGGRDGISFCCMVRAKAEGGSVSMLGNKILVDNARSFTVYLTVKTDYYHTEPLQSLCNEVLTRACEIDYFTLLKAHTDDFSALYDRVALTASNSESETAAPEGNMPETLCTDVRLARTKEEPGYLKQDPSLPVLYFNFGRYLTISGSRPGTLPLNLQGIWCKDSWPAWGSKYTININAQMNYWPTEIVNLPEFHLPLIDLIERMRERGRVTASEMYGCRGFCAHHNTDLWGDTAPQDRWMPSTVWPMGAAWLCLHIYEHYAFTGDKAFLAQHYDAMKEVALFITDYLFEDAAGRLVTGPSVSPENTYRTASGTQGCLCIGPSMDSQIILCLFDAIEQAAQALGINDPEDVKFRKQLSEMSERIPRPAIAPDGRIPEWADPTYQETEPGHRHISHLFALHPGNMITGDPEDPLTAAAQKVLDVRLQNGGGHTGWSRAWIINFQARLRNAQAVEENLSALLGHSTTPNLLDSHPPFQIDGNFGGCAGIAESLIQSHLGYIRLLPALIPAWDSGNASGLMARGAFELSFTWEHHAVTSVCVTSHAGNVCTLELSAPHDGITITSNDEPVAFTRLSPSRIAFATEAETTYTIQI
ncbi:MAG: glycoside hydrolase N-terminal domain-containing protein [Lachnospiraceae bacterium]|nr:glycoside hydrolase N-terminal domain-containing protein [Lachnospiraceae bacterium]